jgi:hypothetical protein
MAATTTLDAAYVRIAELNILLARLFPGNYKVIVSTPPLWFTLLMVIEPDRLWQISGDFVEITAPRQLTSVSRFCR